ncbi:dual specificity tyrosine-phosphorylation-regulated kinase 2-like [Petromyzon marinus]|uniref:dual specificity tyrosine-phosphorylation-regulated kinase 2-like n=1 Tax=Petromyzon marinus TaxID=7757 RepID=UPI003F72AE87
MCACAEVLDKFKDRMTEQERQEILCFNEVFYFKIRSERNGPSNDGYDDIDGHYIPITGEHLVYRFQVLNVLGKGSFGQVLRCLDHKTKREVAIKLLEYTARNDLQKCRREAHIMNALQSKDNENNYIIRFIGHLMFRKHPGFVMELMTIDLFDQFQDNFTIFAPSRIRLYARSMLRALAKLKKEAIIYGDLKMENIMVKDHATGNIRIIDFGASIKMTKPIFGCFGTWKYMAPEMFLGLQLTCAVDMWSLGCVIAELSSGYPLLQTTGDYIAQMITIFGLPPRSMIDAATDMDIYTDKTGCHRVNGRKVVPSTTSLKEKLRTTNRELIDFVQGCLEWDPARRLTPEEALNHRWLQDDTKDESHASHNEQDAVDASIKMDEIVEVDRVSQCEQRWTNDSGSDLEEDFVSAKSQSSNASFYTALEYQRSHQATSEAVANTGAKASRGPGRRFARVRQRLRTFLRFVRKHCCCNAEE